MIINNGYYTNNVIKNIINVGNGCGNDKETCVDGYSLYFPCLKNITKGQNVCFNFYVGDNATQEELDLDNIDSLTLDLSGLFGCEYSSYVYPDDIKSLQTDEYSKVLYDDFDIEHKCNLSLKCWDTDLNDIEPNISGKIGEFYLGDSTKLIANDTPTHIFLGWCKYDDFISYSECLDSKLEDFIISDSNEFSIEMFSDIEIIAVYRKRKTYNIIADERNEHCYFEILTNDSKNVLYTGDSIKITEGYNFIVSCKPQNYNLLFEDDDVYTFFEWSIDDEMKIHQHLELTADNNNPFFDGEKINLLAKCVNILENGITKEANIINTEKTLNFNEIIFSYNYPEENQIENKLNIGNFFYENNNIVWHGDNIHNAFNLNNCYIHVKNDKLSLKNEYNDIKIEIKVNALTDSIIKINNESYNIEKDFYNNIECYIKNFGEPINIEVDGEILIDELSIYEKYIDNKGMMELCLSPEDTLKFNTGVLNISGAIMVNGNIFGLQKQKIGEINNLKSIRYENTK